MRSGPSTCHLEPVPLSHGDIPRVKLNGKRGIKVSPVDTVFVEIHSEYLPGTRAIEYNSVCLLLAASTWTFIYIPPVFSIEIFYRVFPVENFYRFV